MFALIGLLGAACGNAGSDVETGTSQGDTPVDFVPAPEPTEETDLDEPELEPFNVDDVDEEVIGGAAATWVNQLGLGETDVMIWRERIQRACTQGVWIPEVAQQLAAEFVAADLPKSIRSDELADPTVSEAAAALWIAAAQVCGSYFPPEALEAGPPSVEPDPELVDEQTAENRGGIDADAELSTYISQNPEVVILATFEWQGGLVAVTDNGPEGIFVERYADPIVILPEPLTGGASGSACVDYAWNRHVGAGRGFIILVAERPGLTFHLDGPVDIDFVPIEDSGRSVALLDLSDRPDDQAPTVTDESGAAVACIQ